jgi:hypothetical protein
MTPQEIVTQLRTNRDKIRNKLIFRNYENSDLFLNLSKDLNIAKNVIKANDHDFYRYIVARLKGKV